MPVDTVPSGPFLGSTVPQYLLFFAAVCLGALVGRTLSYLCERRLKARAAATETEIDDIILRALGRPVVLPGVVLGVVAGRRALTPEEPLATIVTVSAEIPVVIAIAWIAIRLTDGLIETYLVAYVERTESKLDDELVPIVSRVTNVTIVSIAGIMILDTVGYDVTAVIASLGVGGVAVAFASRKTMADVFGGAHILSTKPFLVDDVIEVDGTAGTVEEIGLRTTRIRDFDGRRITLPNSTLANAEVTNVSSEPTRRIKTFIGLSYATTPAEMEAALELAEETVGAVDGVDPERTEALFWEYGATALRIRIEYHIRARGRWPSVKDAINRTIQRAFADAGVDLALPVRPVPVDDRRS